MAVAGQQGGGIIRPSHSHNPFQRNVQTSSSPFLRPRAPTFSCASHNRTVSASSTCSTAAPLVRTMGRVAHRSSSSDSLLSSTSHPPHPVVPRAGSGNQAGSLPSTGPSSTGIANTVLVLQSGSSVVSAGEVESRDGPTTAGGKGSDSGDSSGNCEENAVNSRGVFVKPLVLRTFRDKCSPINGVAFSPDMQYMYTSADDCSLHIYSIHRGVCTRILHANKYGVHAIKILPHSLVSQVASSSGISYSHVQHPAAAPPPGGAAGATCLCLCGTRASAPTLPSAASGHASSSHRGGGAAGEGQFPKGGTGAKAKYAEGGPSQMAGSAGASEFAVRLWNLAENRYLRSYPLNGKVCRWTGLSLNPRLHSFVCCSEDARVRLFALDKEQPLWVRCVSTSHPLAAFDSEGLVLAVYEGQGRLSFFDAKHPQDPFLQFSVSKFLRKGAGGPASLCGRQTAIGSAGSGRLSAPKNTKLREPLCSRQDASGALGPRLIGAGVRGYSFDDERPTSLQFVRGDGEVVFGTSHERLMFFDVFRGELRRILEPRRKDTLFPSAWTTNPRAQAEAAGGDRDNQGNAEVQPHTSGSSHCPTAERDPSASGESLIRQMLVTRLPHTAVFGCQGVMHETLTVEALTPCLKRQKTAHESFRCIDAPSCSRESPSRDVVVDRKEEEVAYMEKALSNCTGTRKLPEDALFHLSPLPFDPVVFPGPPESEAKSPSRVFVPGLSPCGRFVAVGCSDRYVHVFDVFANEGKGTEVGVLGRCDSDPEVVLFNSKFDVFLTAGLNVSLWKHALCKKKACA
ncbi:wd g-beta repeat-containing protein [Cystoisospora suis]|uniref:Wd g-beta repeat-containing protein n=1 Tax=Cystoisospora suis TaxID=483139 RepID=A0A2C6LIM2_9APIC|nr:wd g-beta repeat-containing protein [Cystoisospora suis]